jgi:uncharacterized membrane protein
MLSSLRLKSIAVIIGLLIGPCLVARTLGTETNRAARLGLALVFGFTALGHFAKTDAMAEMLPPSMPKRRAVIWISGVFEAGLAVAILACSKCPWVGQAIIGFLIAIFPSNIYSAIRRVDFGGHAAGPRYLIVRAPLQLLLILWTFRFVLKGRP